MLDVSLKDRIRHEVIQKRTMVIGVGPRIGQLKLRWVGAEPTTGGAVGVTTALHWPILYVCISGLVSDFFLGSSFYYPFIRSRVMAIPFIYGLSTLIPCT